MNKYILKNYGAITNHFSQIAQMSKIPNKISDGKIKMTRTDCYEIDNDLLNFLKSELICINLKRFEAEIFYPSMNYPPHRDSEETTQSFMIPLQQGNFYYGGVVHPIVPFTLYEFDDSVLHNTDFAAIMISPI